MQRRALVVDDDAVSRLVLCHMLRARGWAIDEAANTPEALSQLSAGDFDLVVSDFHLPSGTGLDILEAMEASGSTAAFILVTGIIEYSTQSAEIAERGAIQLTKPVSSVALREALERIFPPRAE